MRAKPSAGWETRHAHFWLPRHRLSDRLAFGASTDGCGRDDYSSCNTRWNAIAVSADRRGSTEPRRLTAPNPPRPRALPLAHQQLGDIRRDPLRLVAPIRMMSVGIARPSPNYICDDHHIVLLGSMLCSRCRAMAWWGSRKGERHEEILSRVRPSCLCRGHKCSGICAKGVWPQFALLYAPPRTLHMRQMTIGLH